METLDVDECRCVDAVPGPLQRKLWGCVRTCALLTCFLGALLQETAGQDGDILLLHLYSKLLIPYGARNLI